MAMTKLMMLTPDNNGDERLRVMKMVTTWMTDIMTMTI